MARPYGGVSRKHRVTQQLPAVQFVGKQLWPVNAEPEWCPEPTVCFLFRKRAAVVTRQLVLRNDHSYHVHWGDCKLLGVLWLVGSSA